MIKSTSLDNFTIYTLNDSYLTILNEFLAGNIPYTIISDKETRAVWVIEVAGKKYTVKWNYEKINHFDKKLKIFLQGTFYPNLLKRIKKAKSQGCDIVGSIYIVAEYRNANGLETYLLSEYVEGKPLWQFGDDWINYKEAIKTTVKQLHQYGLASSDLNGFNILIAPDNKVKIIDLSDDGFFPIAKVKDARQLKRFYDIEFNTNQGFLYHLIGLRDNLIKLSRKIRNKK